MRTRVLLSATLLLSACQLHVPAGLAPQAATPAASSVPRPKATPTPSPSPSAAASAQPTPVASGAVALEVLMAPSAKHTVLKGTTSLDARYLIDTGLGKLIGQAGTNLIGQAGTNVVAAAGGKLIGQAGTNLIGQAGTNLIGQAGTNLIGQAGTNLIGKRKFALLAADALPLGTVLRATEMEIQVFSLRTGEAVPVGVDANGRQVLSIYSNLTGDFTLYLPDGLKPSEVRLVATVPDSKDERLVYDLLLGVAGGTQATFDEDTALVSRYLRRAFVRRLERLFIQQQNIGEGATFADLLPAPFNTQPIAKDIGNRLSAAAAFAGAASLPEAQRYALASKTADALLAYLPSEAFNAVVPPLKDMFVEARTKAGEKMAAAGEKDYFADKPYMLAANARRQAAGLPPYGKFLKPAEVGQFLLDEYIDTPDRTRYSEVQAPLDDLGAAAGIKARVNSAIDAVLLQLAIIMLKEPKAVDDAEAAIKRGL